MKKIVATIKLHIEAGKATPAPPIGPALAQHGINIGEFCQKFNDASREQEGFKVPVVVRVYEDRSFDFDIKTPLTSQLLKKEANIEKGSGTPNKRKVAKITKEQLRRVAEKKLPDLNTNDIEQAMKIVQGTARNMGIEVEE